MTDKGAGDLCGAAQALGAVETLLLLDSIWTDSLSRQRTIPSHDVPLLRTLVSDLDTTLGSVGLHARTIEDVVRTDPERWYKQFRENLAQMHTYDASRRFLGAAIPDAGGLVQHIERCVSTLARTIPMEQETLRTKMAQIAVDGSSFGDLTKETDCALAGLSFGFGLVTGDFFAVGFGIGVAAGAGCFD